MTRSAVTDADDTAALEFQIEEEIKRRRIAREAQRRLDIEERGAIEPPEILMLRERLARPRNQPRFVIHGWQPTNARVMLAAQFKGGKTTLVGNYIRTRVDGDPWLGLARVAAPDGSVALIDLEMATSQMDDWLQAQGIRNDHHVLVVPLRGHAAAFNILDRRVRAEWAERFRSHQVRTLVLDCLRPALDAQGLDEQKDAGRFLVALDALLEEAGIADALVVQHMGHVAERARGDSRLRDWPDVEWRLVRQDDNPSSPRFISAYGRDVDQPEQQLAFDLATRRLTLQGGSRQDAKAVAALQDVIAVLCTAYGPQSGRAVKAALSDSGHTREAIEAALRLGVAERSLAVESGPRNSRLYRQASQCPEVSREYPADSASECPAALIEPDTRTLTREPEVEVFGPDTDPSMPTFDPKGWAS